MSAEERDRIAAALSSCEGSVMSAERIGEAVAATSRELETALAPVLGRNGVGAIFKRSLHLVTPSHPWLPAIQEDLLASMDLAPLQQAMARQTGADAAAAGADLLQTFRDLLAGLVGAPLTERLLRSVWAPFSSGPPARDPPR